MKKVEGLNYSNLIVRVCLFEKDKHKRIQQFLIGEETGCCFTHGL